MAKTLDLIPSLKDRKFEVFRADSEQDPVYNRYPPTFYEIKFAWKDREEFIELSLEIEKMAEDWKNLPWRYGDGGFYKSYAYRFPGVKKFMMEEVLGRLMEEEINKLTKI